jgi:hypothetical protein
LPAGHKNQKREAVKAVGRQTRENQKKLGNVRNRGLQNARTKKEVVGRQTREALGMK